MAKRSKPHSIYSVPENWKRIERRASKANMKISPFGVLCCKLAAERETNPPPKPTGHPLVLHRDGQRRLHADVKARAESSRILIREPGGLKVTVRLDEALAVLRLCEVGGGA